MGESNDSLAWILAAAAVWILQFLTLLSPIDLIPDFIPVIGLVDDALGFLLASAITIYGAAALWRRWRALPQDVREPLSADTRYEPVSEAEIAGW